MIACATLCRGLDRRYHHGCVLSWRGVSIALRVRNMFGNDLRRFPAMDWRWVFRTSLDHPDDCLCHKWPERTLVHKQPHQDAVARPHGQDSGTGAPYRRFLPDLEKNNPEIVEIILA